MDNRDNIDVKGIVYSLRNIAKARVLRIDLNVGTPEIFEEAQVRVLGQEHVYPMIAFGTLKKRSAFKLYAKAEGLDFQLANTVSEQIGNYEEAVKKANEDDKDAIDIYDYVDAEYEEYVEKSKKYWGIISDKKKAPSAYLLYQGNIRREIGLIKCKSESTKKEYITCVIDGSVAENYKFLKNDILKVDVVLLIDKVFKRIGMEQFDVNELLRRSENDDKVWDLYAKGFTIGLNQVEQEGTKRKCMKYKPHNISELSAFVAAVRPGFKSMYSRFEKREEFSYGLPSLDNLIQTKQFPFSFMIYQENIMSVLHYAGFPMDQCYGIIKAIAKKHPEKVLPLKSQFLEGFKNRIVKDEHISVESADEYSAMVWQVINDNVSYSFNSSHAYSVALDSLYQAWQKANYPFEFYETLLQHYSDKGDKDKVAALRTEMKIAFKIKEGTYKFHNDNRAFVSDKENNVIYPSLVSIKGFSQKVANALYEIGKKDFSTFTDVLIEIGKNKIIKINHLKTLIDIDYFSEFGNQRELLRIMDFFNETMKKGEVKQIKVDSIKGTVYEDIIRKYSSNIGKDGKELKSYTIIDAHSILIEHEKKIKGLNLTDVENIVKIRNFKEAMGYVGYFTENEEDRKKLYVLFLKPLRRKKDGKQFGYFVITKSVGSGKESRLTVFNRVYEKDPFEEDEIIYCDGFEPDGEGRFILTAFHKIR